MSEPLRFQLDDLQFRNILQTAMDGIVSLDSQQNIILFNAAAEEIFGWRADQVIGRSIDMLIPEQFRSRHRSDVEQFGNGTISNRRMGTQRTVLGLKASGETFPMEASISKSSVRGEQVYTVILRDVTEATRSRHQIEQQLQILDQISDAVSVVDLQGRITYWNRAATRMFGWTAAEAIGQMAPTLLYRGDPAFIEKMLHETNTRLSWAGELVKINREGQQIVVEHRRTVLRGTDGTMIGYLCIDIDITERKKRERASHRSQRLESIGTLAGGIAHDLNNVLTPIVMGAELLASGRAPANSKGLLDTMVASAHRGAQLVKQLLAFAGGIRGERSPVQIEPLVAETRGLLDHTFPKSIRIETHVDAGCPKVMGDATELSQILMNLAINARDAMPDGGVLTIDATSVWLDEISKQLHPEARHGCYVLLKVTDTGIGMSPEVLDRIFDPFFTTKELGKGTGLGLATVQGIIKNHGGFINVYSEVGRGSNFSIYLPATEPTEAAVAAAMPPCETSGQGLTILVVDDEEAILQVASAALERAGYRVLTANEGTTAIALYTRDHLEISAVLLDVMMPGLDGLRTLDELRRIDPDVRVVACSGLRTTKRESETVEHGAFAFLPKPFSDVQLLEALAAAVQSSIALRKKSASSN